MDMTARHVYFLWLRSTWAGWLLGLPFIIVFALIGEAAGMGGAQFLVGAGMGAGTALMQRRTIRDVAQKPVRWLWPTIAGLAAPFLVVDLSNVFGWGIPFSLPVCVVIGAIIAGVLQALSLQLRFREAWIWVAVSTLGWTLAAQTAALADHVSHLHAIRGIWGALLFLGIVGTGGLLLGAVTGIFIAWMFGAPGRRVPGTWQQPTTSQ